MPETLPVFVDTQQAVPSDVTQGFRDARASLGNVVRAAVEPGLAYEGFPMVANVGDTQIQVGTGWFYKYGDVYGRYENQVLDLLNDLPPYDQVILAVVASGRLASKVEGRAFLRSTERNPDGSRNVYQKDTQTQEIYLAELSIVPGEVAATARPPASVGNDRVAVAYVLATPAGIVSITPVTGNRVTNARRQRVELARVGTILDGYAPRLASLNSALTGLADEVAGKATSAETRQIKVVLARLQEAVNLPDTRTDQGSDKFLTDDESDKTFAGYDAKIDEAIRFPSAAEITVKIEPLSSLDTSIVKSGTLVLPAYKERQTRVAAGRSGILQLNTFSINNEHSIIKAEMTRQRQRFGVAFEVSSSSSFWSTGAYVASNGAYQVFVRNGEQFQVYDTGREDAEGHRIRRLRRFWTDTITGEAYTSRQPTSHTLQGYDWVQTFIQPEDAIVVALGPHIAKLPAAGTTMTLGLCDTTDGGSPDTKRMLTYKEIPQESWRAVTDQQAGATRQAITPTLLGKGADYGFYLSTAADFWVYVADLEAYRDGTLFFRPTPIVWQSDPTRAIMLDQWVADFARPRTELQLKPLNLAGGFNSIDILAKLVEPAGTRAVFEIEEGAQYRQLGVDTTLSGTPETAAWRLVFNGSTQLQPLLDLDDATVTLSRPKTAFKHASTVRTTPAAVRTVFVTATLEQFNSAKHTCALKLFANGGEVVPASVVDEVDPADPKRRTRTATFTFAAPGITSFRRIVTGTTTDTGDLFHVAEILDVTQAT